MKRVLLTGSTGFVGMNMLKKLTEANFEVKVLVRKKSNLSLIKQFKPKFIFGELMDKRSLKESVRDVDYIIHCAGVIKAMNKREYYNVNYLGTKNLLEQVLRYNKNLKMLIYISSQAACGPVGNNGMPISDYGMSKLLAEKEILKLNNEIPYLILRPSAIYGPYDKAIYPFFKLANLGYFPILSDGVVQLLFVEDLCEICLRICSNSVNLKSKIYFVGAESTDWFKISDTFSIALGRKLKKIKISPPLLNTISFLERSYKFLLKKPPLLSRKKVKEILSSWSTENSQTKKDFQFSFTPLIDGLRTTYNWYLENGWL